MRIFKHFLIIYAYSLFFSLILFYNFSIANIPVEEREVIFTENVKDRIGDQGSEYSNPKPLYHLETNKVRYLRAYKWNVIKQRVAELPDFNSHEEAARFFLSKDSYGPIFGLKDQLVELEYINDITESYSNNPDYIDRIFVRFKQKYNNIEVFGCEIIVQLNVKNELLAIFGEILPNINISINPNIDSSSAIETAKNYIKNKYSINNINTTIPIKSELKIYNSKMIGGGGSPSDSLVWSIEITTSEINEIILVEANFGNMVVENFEKKENTENLLSYNNAGSIALALSNIRFDMIDINDNLPDRINSPFYECSSSDYGGVEVNSNIALKAAYLLINGGEFNNYTINPIGFDKVNEIFKEASYLLPKGGDYNDFYYTLLQACKNLGYSTYDYQQIDFVCKATEMDKRPCSDELPGRQIGKTDIPKCNSGISVNNLFFDGLEEGGGNWQSGIIYNNGSNYWFAPQTFSTIGLNKACAANGKGNIWSFVQSGVSDTYISMNKDIYLPVNSFLHFNHAFQFEYKNNSIYKNGGIVEYSLNSGSSWIDAKNLFVKNSYNGQISSASNSLNGRYAFVSDSKGYISSKLDLNSLSGNSIRFRFRISTSGSTSYYGWYIDDVRIYNCDLISSIPSICTSNYTIKTTNNGNWTNSSIWNLGRIPNNNDIVRIDSSVNINIRNINVKGICNNGNLYGENNIDINIHAKDFINNSGRIWAANGSDAYGSSPGRYKRATRGRNLYLKSYAINNNSSGNIQAGRGGHDRTYKQFYYQRINSFGGRGGNLNIRGNFIVNYGKIGPDIDNPKGFIDEHWYSHWHDRSIPSEDVDGGNGGIGSNWCTWYERDNVYGRHRYNYGSSYGGNGGSTIVIATDTLRNEYSGRINSGNGGYAREWLDDHIPGKGGSLIYSAPNTVLKGSLHAGLTGSAMWDPSLTISDAAKISGVDNLVISGGYDWDFVTNELDYGAIQAKSIKLSVGGLLDISGNINDIFVASEGVNIYSDLDNIITNETRSNLKKKIAKTFDAPEIIVSPSEILFEFKIIADSNNITGHKNELINNNIMFVNNSPYPDSFEITVKMDNSFNLEGLPDILNIDALSSIDIPITITLPSIVGEENKIIISADSITSPDRKEVMIINSLVNAELADFDVDLSDETNPLKIKFSSDTINDEINISSYLWDFGDSNTSSEKNPAHSYIIGGNYPVKLTVTDSNGNIEVIRKNISVKQLKILLMAADYIEAAKTALVSTGLFQEENIDKLERPSSISLSDLASYNAVLVWTSYPFSNPENIGNVLKEYVDSGGGLVIATYSFSKDWGIQGGILEPNYSPFLPGNYSNVSGVLDLNSLIDSNHYIFNGINESPVFWVNKYSTNPILNEGAGVLAKDTIGNNVVGVNADGNVVGIAIYPERLTQGNSYAKLLIANALSWVAGETAELTISPINQNVPASNGQVKFIVLNTGNDILHWKAETDDYWLTIEKGDSGANEGEIIVNYEAYNNPEAERIGKIKVYGVGALNSPLELKIIQSKNQSPFVSDIGDQSTFEDTSIDIPFSVKDEESSSFDLIVSARSSDKILIPDNGISISNPGLNRLLKIEPAKNRFGNSIITVTVSDGLSSYTDSFNLNVIPVNDSPYYNISGDIVLSENEFNKSYTQWAFNISEGEFENQNIQFNISTDNESFFSVLPEISNDGLLSFTANGNGSASVSVYLIDDGGNDNGGNNSSVIKTFTIKYEYIPHFKIRNNKVILEDSGIHEVENWVSEIVIGPNGNKDYINFYTSNNNASLFDIQPTIDDNGKLTFKSALNANGIALVQTYMTDGGITNNTSVIKRFYIKVLPVNDQPSFEGTDIESLEDSGTRYIKKWAKNIIAGADDENWQSFTFTISNNNNDIFKTQPVILSNGTMVYCPKPDINGVATIDVSIMDNGGTYNNGIDKGIVQKYTITIKPVNDPPVFEKGNDQIVYEDASNQTIHSWARNIYRGPEDESNQNIQFICNTDNPDLFLSGPEIVAVGNDGTLSYTVAPDANGTAIIKIFAKDSGGNIDGGNDISMIKSFNITVLDVGDCPLFAPGNNQEITASGDYSIENWATNISAGNKENNQVINFVVSNDNSNLFSNEPKITSDGTLTYSIKPNIYGIANVSVFLQDNDPLIHGGCYKTNTITFTIKVLEDIDITKNLEININGNGSVFVNGSKCFLPWNFDFTNGSNIYMEAIPEDDWKFVGWDGLGLTENSVNFEINENRQITANFIKYKYTILLKKGWNIVGLPVISNDNSLNAQFPNAEVAYKYVNGAYISVETIEPQKGYWIKVPSDTTYQITGEPFEEYSVSLNRGWFILAAVNSKKTPITDPIDAIEVIYQFRNGAYVDVDELCPGFGYWIKIVKPCNFLLK